NRPAYPSTVFSHPVPSSNFLLSRREGDRAIDFVAPDIPTRRFLAGKKLYPGLVAHQLDDLIPHNIRLFSVLLGMGNDTLMDSGALPCGIAAGSQKAHLRVRARPEPHTVKPGISFAVLFQPQEGQRFILESPGVNDADRFFKLGKRTPKKKCAVLGRKVRNWKRTDFLNAHRGIMVFRNPVAPLHIVTPRRVRIDDPVFFILRHQRAGPSLAAAAFTGWLFPFRRSPSNAPAG